MAAGVALLGLFGAGERASLWKRESVPGRCVTKECVGEGVALSAGGEKEVGEMENQFEGASDVATQVAEAAVVHGEYDHQQSERPVAPEGSKVYVGNVPFSASWQDLKDHMRRAGDVQHVRLFLDQYGQSKGCALVEYSSREEAQYAIQTLHNTPLGSRMIFVREDREGSGSAEDGGAVGGMPGVVAHGMGGLGADVLPMGDGGMPPMVSYRGAFVPGFRGGFRGVYRPMGGGRGGYRGGFRGMRGMRGGRGRFRGNPRPTPGIFVYFGNLPYSTRWRELKSLAMEAGLAPVRADVVMSSPGRSKGYGFVVFQTEEEADKCVSVLNGYEMEGRTISVHINRPVGQRDSAAAEEVVGGDDLELVNGAQ